MTRLTPGCPDQPRNFTGILHTHRHYTRQCPMHAKPGHQNNTEYPDNRNQRWTIYFDLVKRENPALPAWYSPSSSSNSVGRYSPSAKYHPELKSFQTPLQPAFSESPLLICIMPEGASQLIAYTSLELQVEVSFWMSTKMQSLDLLNDLLDPGF